MSTVDSFLRWHSMDFCSVRCVNELLSRNHADRHRCWECDARIKISKLFVHMQYIEAELRNFCSEKCSITYMDAIRMCDYCQKKMSAEDTEKTNGENDMKFCSSECKDSCKQIIDGSIESTPYDDASCTDCNQFRPAALKLHYKGQSHPFCSLACFSYTRIACGIYAGNKMKRLNQI